MYDIFISYRRLDTRDKAEHLKDLLELRYKGRVSFDRENLTGPFDVALAKRIDACRDFLLVLGKESLVYKAEDFAPGQVELYRYLASCSIEDFERKLKELGPDAPLDFVRIEIARALHRKDLNIIPVVPERTPDYSFGGLDLPPDIVDIKRYEAVFYSDSPDALFKDVMPKIQSRLKSKADAPKHRLLKVLTVVLVLLGVVCAAGWYISHRKEQQMEERRQALMKAVADKWSDVVWADDVTLTQVETIIEILDGMEPVEGGAFMMGALPGVDGMYDADVDTLLDAPALGRQVEDFMIGRYEVTVGQWRGIMGGAADGEAPFPMRHLAFHECMGFADCLMRLTNLNFDLPTEEEWEFAARGGIHPDGTRYAGGDSPDKVAWYEKNSGGVPHACDATRTDKDCNGLNLFDMSGNVAEWCNSDFRLYRDLSANTPHPEVLDSESKVVRGGSYESLPYELTVYHRIPVNANTALDDVGFRLVIRK